MYEPVVEGRRGAEDRNRAAGGHYSWDNQNWNAWIQRNGGFVVVVRTAISLLKVWLSIVLMPDSVGDDSNVAPSASTASLGGDPLMTSCVKPAASHGWLTKVADLWMPWYLHKMHGMFIRVCTCVSVGVVSSCLIIKLPQKCGTRFGIKQ